MTDYERLNDLAGVTLTKSAVADMLEMTTFYLSHQSIENMEMLLAAGYAGWLSEKWDPRTATRDARRAWVEFVEGTWRSCRGKRSGSYYDPAQEIHTGPLIRLMQELLRIAGDPKPPSARTLHRDLVFLYTGREEKGRR